jgi:hypothetical protein
VPREDAVREKAVRKRAALQDLDLARVSQPKMDRGCFLVDWNALKFVAGGPQGTPRKWCPQPCGPCASARDEPVPPSRLRLRPSPEGA